MVVLPTLFRVYITDRVAEVNQHNLGVQIINVKMWILLFAEVTICPVIGKSLKISCTSILFNYYFGYIWQKTVSVSVLLR